MAEFHAGAGEYGDRAVYAAGDRRRYGYPAYWGGASGWASKDFRSRYRRFFTPEMTEMTDQPTNLLAEGIHFHFVRDSPTARISG